MLTVTDRVEVQRCAQRSDPGESSGAHCDPELVKRIGEKLGEEDLRDTWRRGLARHLAKKIEEEEEKEEEEQTALLKSSNPHLAGGEHSNIFPLCFTKVKMCRTICSCNPASITCGYRMHCFHYRLESFFQARLYTRLHTSALK